MDKTYFYYQSKKNKRMLFVWMKKAGRENDSYLTELTYDEYLELTKKNYEDYISYLNKWVEDKKYTKIGDYGNYVTPLDLFGFIDMNPITEEKKDEEN